MDIRRIFITFDSFFDTRLPTLEAVNPAGRRAVFSNPEYWLRDQNDWGRLSGGLVNNEEFAAQWAKRDNDIRWGSVITGIHTVLLRILTDYNIIVRDGITNAEISIDFNVWPYTLIDDEVLEIEPLLRRFLGDEIIIQFTSISHEELTPHYLTEHYSLAVMYDFHEWLRVQAETFYRHKANRFNMIAPRIFENSKAGQLTVEQKQKEVQRFRMDHMEFMDIDFIDAKYFSQFRP